MSAASPHGARPGTRVARPPGRLRILHEKFVVEERYVRPQDRRNLYLVALALAVVGIVAFTVLLSGVTTHSGLALLDHPVEQWFTHRRDQAATTTMIVLAIVFGPIGMPIVVFVVTTAWTVAARHAWRPLVLAGGMVLGVITAQVVARLVERSRPPLSLMLLDRDVTFSFPSGHVLGVCDFFLITAFLIASRRRSKRLAAAAFLLAAGAIALQIASRLYLGYHWLTDTLASVSLSLVILAVVITVDTWRTVRVPGEPVVGPLSVVAHDARDPKAAP